MWFSHSKRKELVVPDLTVGSYQVVMVLVITSSLGYADPVLGMHEIKEV